MGQYADQTEADSLVFSDYTWYKFTQDIDPVITQMQGDISTNATAIDNNYQDLIQQLGDKATEESVTAVTNRVATLETSTAYNISVIEDIQVNGVSSVTTSTGFTFNENGLNIEKTGAKTKSQLNESYLAITDTTGTTQENLLFAGYDSDLGETIVKTKNLKVEKYMTIGNHSRFEDYGTGTGCFYIGG